MKSEIKNCFTRIPIFLFRNSRDFVDCDSFQQAVSIMAYRAKISVMEHAMTIIARKVFYGPDHKSTTQKIE